MDRRMIVLISERSESQVVLPNGQIRVSKPDPINYPELALVEYSTAPGSEWVEVGRGKPEYVGCPTCRQVIPGQFQVGDAIMWGVQHEDGTETIFIKTA